MIMYIYKTTAKILVIKQCIWLMKYTLT